MPLEHKQYQDGPGDFKLNGVYLGPRDGVGIDVYNMLVDLTNHMELPSISQTIKHLIREAHAQMTQQGVELYPAIEDLIDYDKDAADRDRYGEAPAPPDDPDYDPDAEPEPTGETERQRLDRLVNETEL